MDELLLKIKSLLSEKKKVVVAVDGPCASGKTTLANSLAKKLDAFVIRMDDFFLRSEQRSAERLAEPGGNLDRERFLEEVLIPLKKGEKFSFRPYLCSMGKLGDEIFVPKKSIYIIEGSYSHHPYFGDAYDLRVFLEIDPKLQKERLAKRDPDKLDRFLAEWIPMEAKYFSHFSIPEKADFII
ncbi:MAG: (d)CMP kinase [Clostridia bacterium]|nr:(d)CMP kinase [Clostridia bacterium]